MDDEIDRAPFRLQCTEHRVHALAVGDIAGQQDLGADTVGQRFHTFAERIALIGEGEFRTVIGEHFGDAPGDGMIIGDAHDEAAFAFHQGPGER